MSYNFKSLGEVELLDNMPEAANVLVEVDGGVRRAPQVKPVDEIAQIVGSETLEEVPEDATVLAEVGGEIKRVPSKGLGGGSLYDMPDVVVFTTFGSAPICNKTFKEILDLLKNTKLSFVIFRNFTSDLAISLMTEITPRDNYGNFNLDSATNIRFDDISGEFIFYLLDDDTTTLNDPIMPS